MVTEINMVDGSYGWWIDTNASHRVCYDCVIFKIYMNTLNKKVLLGHAHATIIFSIGEVELKFTSEETLILKDVMHALEIRKNLVSRFLLNTVCFSLSIRTDMYTITKNHIFVEESLCD